MASNLIYQKMTYLKLLKKIMTNAVFVTAIPTYALREEFSRKINVDRTIKIIDYLNKNKIYFIFFHQNLFMVVTKIF